MEKRRKIFDDGAATVEEVTVKKNKKTVLEVSVDKDARNNNKVNGITVSDVIDTFAGYLPSQANFMPRDGGVCLFCGKETTSSMRKLCFDCLQKNGQEIYNMAKKSVEMGDKEFKI